MKKIFLQFLCVLFLFPATGLSSNGQNTFKQIAILKSDAEHKEKWQAKEGLVRIGQEAVGPLIDALKDENAKYYAIRALGEIKDERAVEALATVLLDKNYGARRYAAIALGSIKSPKALPALQAALNDEKGYVIKDTLTALQYIDPSQGDSFLQKIISQQNPNGMEIKLSASKESDNIHR
jgi:HEAT repeat protein